MSEVVLTLNYGTLTKFRVSPEAPESYALHYSIPPPGGRGIDCAGSLRAVQSVVEQFFPGKIKDLEQLVRGVQYDIDWLRQGYCIAICKSGTGIYDYTCERARERCELWQGGFVRFVTLEELQYNLAVTQDVLSKVSADYEALKAFFAQLLPPLTPTKVEVSVVAHEGGTTDPPPGTYRYDWGSEVWVAAIPSTGYLFDYWLINGVKKTDNPVRITPTTRTTVEAFFKQVAPPPTPPAPTPTPTPPTEVKPVPAWALVGLGLAVATVIIASRKR
jgi:hypothetical protein